MVMFQFANCACCEILHQAIGIGGLSRNLSQVFYHPRWCRINPEASLEPCSELALKGAALGSGSLVLELERGSHCHATHPQVCHIYIYSYITYQYITCHNQLWPLWESPKQPAVTAVTPMSDERRMRIWQRSGKSQMRSLTARDDDEKKCSEVRIVGPE